MAASFAPIPVEELTVGYEIELPSGLVVDVERVRRVEPELMAGRFYPERFVVDWRAGTKIGTLAIAFAGETWPARRAADPEPVL